MSLVLDRSAPLRFTFTTDSVSMDASGTEQARASESVDAHLIGDDVTLGLNPQYLLESLGAVRSEFARITFTSSDNANKLSPVLITPQTSVDKAGGRIVQVPAAAEPAAALTRSRLRPRPPGSTSAVRTRVTVIVEQLSLVDFRNYAVAEISLGPGPNVFVGRNGQGKTNLAEAIAFFATLGSHRVSSDAPMVRDGADAAIIRARLSHGDRRVLLEVQLNRQGTNKARVNGAPVKPAELPRHAQVVLFAPEDLQIVRGDPSARRRFADQLLVQRTPRLAACSPTTTGSSSSAPHC